MMHFPIYDLKVTWQIGSRRILNAQEYVTWKSSVKTKKALGIKSEVFSGTKGFLLNFLLFTLLNPSPTGSGSFEQDQLFNFLLPIPTFIAIIK